jgi:hypothetical protein
MYFVSSYGSFAGALFYCFLGFRAINFDQLVNDEGKYGNILEHDIIFIEVIGILLSVLGLVILIILTIIFVKVSNHNFNKLIEEDNQRGNKEIDSHDKRSVNNTSQNNSKVAIAIELKK